ncbi:MAG: hypothetical protein LC641_00045 [Spirochaeta sp.]|nr:hypothetical protein [Spirochaeta sp.]
MGDLRVQMGEQALRTLAAQDKESTGYILVRMLHTSETALCRMPDTNNLRTNDCVMVPTKYGSDLALVLGPVDEENSTQWKEILTIDRIAGDQDLASYESNLELEYEAREVARAKIIATGLDMKLVSVHYLIDEPKIVFFFTADGRVDFRDLVKELVSRFRMRIELRQIGVRDESRFVGGKGVCGRGFCCHGVTDKLKPVSIKMAKVQNLSLNSMKISGSCGRLLCCLAYEYDFYRSERKTLPDEGNRIHFEGDQFRVVDVNVLTRQIRVLGSEGRSIILKDGDYFYDKQNSRWSVREAGSGVEVL